MNHQIQTCVSSINNRFHFRHQSDSRGFTTQELIEEYNKLKQHACNLEIENDKLLEECRLLGDQYEKKCQDNLEQYEYLKEEYRGSKVKWDTQRDQMEITFQKFEQKVAKLQNEIINKVEENQSLKQQLDVKQAQISMMHKEYCKEKIEQKKILQKETQNFLLQRQNKQKLAEIVDELKKKQEQNLSEIQFLSTLVEHLEQEGKELTNKIALLNDKIQSDEQTKEFDQKMNQRVYSPDFIERNGRSVERSSEKGASYLLSQILNCQNNSNFIRNKENFTINKTAQKQSLKFMNKQIKTDFINEFSLSEVVEPTNPYFAFFLLVSISFIIKTVQCVKINSEHFEEIAEFDINSEWDKLLEDRVPMNKWQQHISRKLLELYHQSK